MSNGAQKEGCAWRVSLPSMSTSMDWRRASARPIALFAASRRTARVTSFTAASESTSQCETSSARGLRIEEGAGEPRQRLGPRRAACRRVAGRQDHSIRIELQRSDFGGGEIAVVLFAGLGRRRQQQPWLPIASNLARQRAIRRAMHDPVLRQLTGCAQPFYLALRRTQPDFSWICVEVWRLARQKRGSRSQFFNTIAAATTFLIFPSWDDFLQTIAFVKAPPTPP